LEKGNIRRITENQIAAYEELSTDGSDCKTGIAGEVHIAKSESF
jgi:hypothetical protein